MADYRDYIQDNFSDVYLHTTQKHNVKLPNFMEINRTNVEIILIAKKFSLTQIDRVKKLKENTITLIKYFWFEDDLIFIDYINNDPDEIKIESVNAKKINDIRKIIVQDPEVYEIDRFFSLKPLSKDAFLLFWEKLKGKGNVELEFQQTKIKVKINEHTFSVIGYGGKAGRKAILQINTNIQIPSVENIIIEDRDRGVGKKRKGSLGSERYEAYIRNNDEIVIFADLIVKQL